MILKIFKWKWNKNILEKKIEERKQANAELIEKIRRLQAKQIETMGKKIFLIKTMVMAASYFASNEKWIE